MSIFETGLLGEMRAAAYLRKQGMRIIASRYRTPHGEIDLIAREGDTLVFVEGKPRLKGKIGEGERAVNVQKRGHIRYAAQYYLLSHPENNVRFDLVEISAAGLRHRKGAF